MTNTMDNQFTDFAQIVAAVAAADTEVIAACAAGTLDDAFLRGHMPRLMERALEVTAHGHKLHQTQSVYRKALALAIYQDITLGQGLDDIRSEGVRWY